MFRISCFEFRAFLLLAVVLGTLLGGCVSQPQQLAVCPGKATAEEALQTLAAHAKTAAELRSKGEAMLTYHVPDKRNPRRQNLLLELRFSPPTKVYVQGSISVNPKVVIMGSNQREFWLALSPEEISSYYIGEWDEVRGFEGQVGGMSPRVVLEAFGNFVEPNEEPGATWTLQNKGPYDILTRRDETGRMVQRVHVYACDYRIHKIEYFDSRGKVVAVAQFAAYESVTEGFSVPTKIRVVSTTPDGRKDSMDIKLYGVKTTTLNERQREVFFSPPKTDKYENIYRYETGRWVPQ